MGNNKPSGNAKKTSIIGVVAIIIICLGTFIFNNVDDKNAVFNQEKKVAENTENDIVNDTNDSDINSNDDSGDLQDTDKKDDILINENNNDNIGQVQDDNNKEVEEQNSNGASSEYYHFRNEKYLEEHFNKHGGEFDYQTKEEYEAGANKVIASDNALYKTEAEDGDGVYYIEETNEFVILSTDGYIRTYFKPNGGIKYFNRQ